MPKWTLFLAAFIFIQEATAGSLNGKGKETESSAYCIECMKANNTSMDSLKKFTQEMRNMTNGALDIEIASDKMNYNNKCNNFAADGAINKWGAVINKEISRPKYSSLLTEGPKDIIKYCPNFDSMSIQERKALNILILTAMAHYESSCNFREKATGPNGTAAGLLQLHKGREQNYSSGCRKGDSKSPERSLICGLSMINDQINRGENLFSSNSYWEVLRPAGRSRKAKKIMATIAQFPSCSLNTDLRVSGAKRKAKNLFAQK